MKVTDEMVNRFLNWRLPDSFAPDCGITFDGRKPDQWNPEGKGWPVGTNLFTAIQARQMLEFVLEEAAPASPAPVPETGGQAVLAAARPSEAVVLIARNHLADEQHACNGCKMARELLRIAEATKP